VLSEAYGGEAMKKSSVLSSIIGSKRAPMKVTNEENAHQFLRFQGYCSL